jgi:GTPase
LRILQKQVEQSRKKEEKAAKKEGLPVIGLREDDQSWHIEKTENGFIVTGKKIERFARRTNFGEYHAEQRLRDIMRKMGIVRELERQGIEADQTITIGNPVLGQIKY